jgi:hypothetical protein
MCWPGQRFNLWWVQTSEQCSKNTLFPMGRCKYVYLSYPLNFLGFLFLGGGGGDQTEVCS